MRVLFLWSYPRQYYDYFFGKNPAAADLPYHPQREMILDDHCGWAGDLSRYMAGLGFETDFVLTNAPSLQRSWAREQGFVRPAKAGWEQAIAMEQVRRFRPDVIWVPSRFELFGDFYRRVSALTRRVIVWVGEPWPAPDVRGIAVLITENPNTFKAVQDRFERVIVARPGYSPDVLDALGPVEKRFQVSFVGQIHDVHRHRAALMAHLLRNGVPLALFGFTLDDSLPGVWKGLRQAGWELARRRDGLSAVRTLRRLVMPTRHERNVDQVRRYLQPPVFGMEMYRALAASQIVINIHGDIAGRHAGNMRMFETTLVGSCLVTEHSNNIRELFEPGAEVLTFDGQDDLLRVIQDGLNDKARLESIARAGQARTLQCHTTARFFEDIRDAFEL